MAAVYARAFKNDPVIDWFIRDDEKRDQGVLSFFENLLRFFAQPHGMVFTDSSLQSVSLWQPPGSGYLSFPQMLKAIPRVINAAGHENIISKFKGFDVIESQRPKDSNFYLETMGVDPDAQGQGLGALHLNHMLGVCDQMEVAVHLETGVEKNVGLYQKYGFRVMEEKRIVPEGPYLWFMWREPQTS
ncbi:MAG: GNAT family N-acetyltransferase [Pseudomonadales bacterium]|nr:GNAT family N-acetyltransferase [Pseudomonadales bacterium]